jgi:hypothetical protein
MGTRYEDQPVEQWAGPESLDPTPVWKQYILVALLLVVGLVVVLVVSVTALAPSFVTPPALVPGDRLVLAAADVPAVGAPPKLIASPVIDEARSFYLVQPAKGDVVAVRKTWRPRANEPECQVAVSPQPPGAPRGPQLFTVRDCAMIAPSSAPLFFDAEGARMDSRPPRGLDRYLVSVSGDRVIVNLSRIIESSERTGGPVPTGIPQPQQP